MNATPTNSTINLTRLDGESAVRHIFRTICAEFRRGVELTVESYSHGFAPPF